jgi:hypothetical protein
MNSNARFNRRLVLFILASFTIFATAVVLRLGIGATPYDTTDSAGRPMGFNDPLDAEHYAIMIRNFDPTELLKLEYAYEWVLLTAHLVGAGLLLSIERVSPRMTRWFFAVQVVLFPLAFPALLLLPFIVADCTTGRMDREGFVDIPFIWAVCHPIWVITALFITFVYRGSSLGIRRGCSGFAQAARAH